MYMTKRKQVQNKPLRKYRENFSSNYALFYMQGVGIFTEITVCKIVICNIGSHYSFQGSLNLAGVVDNHHKRPRGDERLPDLWIRDALKLEKERQRISDQKSSTMGSDGDGKAKRSRMWAPPLRLGCFSDFL